MPEAYDSLAEWFEYLNDDCDYPVWSQYFIDGLRRLGAGVRGLELGCGSGAFSRALVRAGYRMTGADISAPTSDVFEKRIAALEGGAARAGGGPFHSLFLGGRAEDRRSARL